MEKVIYKIALDVSKAETQKCLTGFSIGESGTRQLKISLMHGRNPIHFDGTEIVSMFVTKPSAAIPSIGLCTLDGDTIIYDVLQSDVAEDGVTKFTLKVQQTVDGEINILYAAHFAMQVTDPECDDSEAPDDPNFSLLEQLVAEVQELDLDSEAWAVGTRGGEPVQPGDPAYNNSAKWWAENVQHVAEEEIQKAEAWASGTKGGVPVGESDPAYHNNSKYYSEQAGTSATNAATSESNASGSASAASGSATASSTSALVSEGYAKGSQNGTPVESGTYFHDNAKYYKEQAATSATNAATSESNASGSASAASGSATASSTSALVSEGYAKGSQNGTPVESGTYFHDNAKYYKEQAATSASNASTSETNAGLSATAASGSASTAATKAVDSEAWATGKRNGVDVPSTDPTYHNNAKYYAEEAGGTALSALTDVQISSAQNGQGLFYDSASQKWKNGTHTNENFIHNPFFRRNTKGQASYANSGYCVDDWKIEYAPSVVVSSDHITISKSVNGYQGIIQPQPTEFWAKLAGKDVTLSLKIGNTIACRTITLPSDLTANWDTEGVYVGAWQLDICGVPNSSCNIRVFNDADMTSADVYAVKLELGSVSTLATDAESPYIQSDFDLSEQIDNIGAILNVYGSKNILDHNYDETVGTGITFTENADGSITANGTATTNCYYNFRTYLYLKPGSYIFSGTPQPVDASVYVYIDSTEGMTIDSTGDGAAFSVLNESTAWACHCYVGSGKTLNNVTFYPMIRDARVTDMEYVPFAKTNQELTDGNDVLKPKYVSDANTLTTNGKVTVSYYNDDSLNTPFKQGVSGVGLGSIITYRNGDGEWIGQVAIPVASTSLFVRGRVSSYYGATWSPWYETAKLIATTTSPTAGASSPYPEDTLVVVYE